MCIQFYNTNTSMFVTNYNYMSKRPVDMMNSCTVKNIKLLKAIENSEFPFRRVLVFTAIGGSVLIVWLLVVEYFVQVRRK